MGYTGAGAGEHDSCLAQGNAFKLGRACSDREGTASTIARIRQIQVLTARKCSNQSSSLTQDYLLKKHVKTIIDK